MKSTFEPKVGDKCVLNSGGPEMTVTELIVDGRVMCRWSNEDKSESSIAVLKPSSLTFVEGAA